MAEEKASCNEPKSELASKYSSICSCN
jgi:hypothetical protein